MDLPPLFDVIMLFSHGWQMQKIFISSKEEPGSTKKEISSGRPGELNELQSL